MRAVAEYGLSEQDKRLHTQRTAFVAAELTRAGAAVIVAQIAPRQESRETVREAVLQSGGGGGNFFLIHVATPLEYCEKTDRRGLYLKARRGVINGFAGIDDTYETPDRADLTLDLTTQSIPEIVHSKLRSNWVDTVANYKYRYHSFARNKRTFVIRFHLKSC
jgi:sulfate adenylyltransferase